MRTAAQAEKRPVRTAYKRTRVRDLPDSPVSAADTKYALESLEHILSSEAELSVLFPHLPVPIARDLLDQHVGPLRQMIARASDVGVQRAYLEAMGIVDSHDKRYLDDVTFDLMFQHHVRSALELLQIPRELVAAISQRVTVEDCPGFWLAHAVELEIRKAESEPASSNAYDLDHVMYAPYVDVFFSDKRIAGHINAVRKRQDTISSISRLPPAVATAARVDAISQAVTNIGSA